MAQAPPTRLHIDPPIDRWRVTPRNGRTKPVIATGHQPTFWHPGILAKYLAVDAYAERIGGSAVNVVVEHNWLDVYHLPYPAMDGLRLESYQVPWRPLIKYSYMPPNVLPPIEQADFMEGISSALETKQIPGSVARGLSLVLGISRQVIGEPNASAQISAMLAALMKPYLHRPMLTRGTTHLVTPGFVDRLLADPVGCVRSYNRAALAYPEAGIRPLYVGRDVVEAPLWAQSRWFNTPVYVDLGDSKCPLLFAQNPSPDLHGPAPDLAGPDALQYLRPRAITLSAIMRSELCDLFIHGTGGGVYDRVTERWWHDWTGEDLAPMAVVTADAYLPFDVPVATPEEHTRAQWFAHHLPHNVDRYTEQQGEAESQLRHEKHDLLDQMDVDRDKRRRAKAFKRIHAINAELRGRHEAVLAQAKRDAEQSRIGLMNAGIAKRRDWCFALYPEASLRGLADQISSGLAPSPG